MSYDPYVNPDPNQPGGQPPHGRSPYGQDPYGQPGQPPAGQSAPQPPYGQAAPQPPYGGPQYGSPQYPQYGVPQYGPPGYGAPGYGGPYEQPGGKSFVVTWLLALLLGGLGIDRFYLGKIGTGILKLITFGGCGIWALIDLIFVLVGHTRDSGGRLLYGYEEHKRVAWIITIVVWVLGLARGVTHPVNLDDLRNNVSAPAAVVVQQTV